MANLSEDRRVAYVNKAVGEQVAAIAGTAAGNGAPLHSIAEAVEGIGIGGDELPPRVTHRPAGGAAPTSRRRLVLTEVRRISYAVPQASWNFLRQSSASAVSYLTPRLAVPSSASLQGMTWRARADFYLSQPEDSTVGWLIQCTIMAILVTNIAVMAAETLDGPMYGSSEPGYTYLPGKSAFESAHAGFTAIYVLEFAVRSVVARHPARYWKSWTTWLDILALLPYFIHAGLDSANKDNLAYDDAKTEDRAALLRVFRAVRLVVLSRMFLGTKILFRVSKEVVAPLKITLFFLITVVMVFATAMFYAEPCYDLSTCTFTDIFNAGYFVMVTVATVGYGSQVPSFSYPGSIFVASVVMLFGSLYLAMPLAIVGIKYDLAWREYDEKQAKLARSPHTALPAAEIMGTARAVKASMAVDDTLETLETTTTTASALELCEQFLEIGRTLLDVETYLGALTKARDVSTAEAATLSARQRSDSANKALDAITSVLKLHTRVCSEVREALSADEGPTRTKSSATLSDRLLSLSRRASSGVASGRIGTKAGLGKAKSALSTLASRAAAKKRVQHENPQSFRARVWAILKHQDRSRRAVAINRFRLVVVVLSIVLFYSQTTPELQLTGLRTVLCRRTIEDFCASDAESGCFVYSASGAATAQPLDFSCAIDASDADCYGAGFNYGSDAFASTCEAAFGPRGASRVCNNRLCQASESFMLDMEPYWVYFEFVFGVLFAAEALLRALAHPVPAMLVGDRALLLDLAVLFPFVAETASIAAGVMPIYSVVPTAPSFLSGVRVLKTLRILKVGAHIPGARVLLKTGELIFRRLLIPLFFLFVGCVVSAAIFYELERGAECFVGSRCEWLGIDVLTPELSAGLPQGKRVLVQNTHAATFVDMLRSTWFSLVTFTTVGYGDLFPRTALGKLLDIVCMIGSACYTAMPLTLVGGQFYVCYEVFVQEEKRRRHGADSHISPKAAAPESDRGAKELASPASSEQLADPTAPLALELAPISLAGLATSAGDAAAAPATVTLAARGGGSRDRGVSSFELQILRQFFLVHKVLNEMVVDMSALNRLGAERVAALKKTGSKAFGTDAATLEAIETRERAVEVKIGDNMVFCMTVYLAFAPLVERGQGHQVHRASRPSITAEAAGISPLVSCADLDASPALAQVEDASVFAAAATASRRPSVAEAAPAGCAAGATD